MRQINRNISADSDLEQPSEVQREVSESPTNESSSNLPALSSVVNSPSMSLIDDSAKLLYDTMLETGKKEKSKDTVKEICQCAEQIHKLMRLKYDVIRTFEGAK